MHFFSITFQNSHAFRSGFHLPDGIAEFSGQRHSFGKPPQTTAQDKTGRFFPKIIHRGIDETGYVLVSGNEIRLRDANPGHLARSALVDWGALLGLMAVAADYGTRRTDNP